MESRQSRSRCRGLVPNSMWHVAARVAAPVACTCRVLQDGTVLTSLWRLGEDHTGRGRHCSERGPLALGGASCDCFVGRGESVRFVHMILRSHTLCCLSYCYVRPVGKPHDGGCQCATRASNCSTVFCSSSSDPAPRISISTSTRITSCQ